MQSSLTIFTHPDMARHENMSNHPECPARLHNIMEMIKRDFPDIPVEDAFPIAEENLLFAHPQSYIDHILDSAAYDGEWSMIDADTGMNDYSYHAALLSAGASVQAVQAVMDGNTQTAFALSRPPGHHAEYDTAMGFCFFANAFVAARVSNVKTLIIDFDVHHGNGTEDLVKRRVDDGYTDIAYASIHQEGIFPHTGMNDSENICNAPLPQGATSQDFRSAIENKIIPLARDFAPDLIIFSAGFDAHESDPIGGLNLQHDDFGWIVEQFKPICPKIVSVLEGGYNLETLPESVKVHLLALR
jgi:acetoin utilization deacetylase AcuC-like enzyme